MTRPPPFPLSVVLLLAASFGLGRTAASAEVEPTAPSTPALEADLPRLRELHRLRKWRELVDEFSSRDFAAADLPADRAAEALHLRGQAYYFLRDNARADADLSRAATSAPADAAVHLALADNCSALPGAEARALAAYRRVVQLTGRNAGWMSLTAAMRTAQLLTDAVRPDEAIEELRACGNLQQIPESWRIRLLRTYGHAYAAAGREAESLDSFRAALALEEAQRKASQP